ncbi:ATP-binding protein [Streptococcus suis]|uniref:ATP-binding protein n=1 Tax=Streptococcus suis TaxID=1307 RepID=UPI00192D9532|nr:ATP-binding protein [Streptococcus suis]MBL6503872.1 ATP-binding protein [Streptococcus suis]MBM0241803.1 ATP-binding protein [Streptococcus suis]MBM7180877.1 ATP-binding protein [Streptococcus suis]MBM7203885.1 ATP-binding protein [Streptococcus suis]MBM7281608.1 ATP-binding protein [Streptococcus suis]
MEHNKKSDDLQFSFSYMALGLLGKNLYSNAWAALSELVANSLDAGSTEVYIAIDMRQKGNSVIEVYDNGEGMSYDNLKENYIKIGRNRRLNQKNSESVMGRKGIGKLAALYLSNHYYVATKQKDTELLVYEMEFPNSELENDTQNPQMSSSSFDAFNNREFLHYESGTMIRMEKVNLTGYGDASIETLNSTLSDYFTVSNLNSQKIFLKVVKNDNDLKKEYTEVIKTIPFKNMVQITCFDKETYDELSKKYSNKNYQLNLKGFDKKFSDNIQVVYKEATGTEFTYSKDGQEKIKVGKITGWIGIHSTINSSEATELNDTNFKKNKLYNPLSLRIYVRNKLAISNFLPVINNTQAFVNYIEGEIGYDILDDNNFKDIATTSRQNMDENDPRVVDLAKKIKQEVSSLIRTRLEVRNKMNNEIQSLRTKSEKIAKESTSKNIDKIFDDFKSQKDRNSFSTHEMDQLNINIKNRVVQQLKGENFKNEYTIFFSHSRRNKNVLDFFYYLLKKIGVTSDEIFYTSKEDAPQIDIKQNLGEISKENIVNKNTLLFFYVTKDFKDSDYCMFEGGAAWATRGAEDYLINFDEYDLIPDYLNQKGEFLLNLTQNSDLSKGDFYNQLINTLNKLIEHINIGRKMKAAEEVPLFNNIEFPDKVELSQGKTPELNKDIEEYWNTYILENNE